jgi:hypothetical protein
VKLRKVMSNPGALARLFTMVCVLLAVPFALLHFADSPSMSLNLRMLLLTFQRGRDRLKTRHLLPLLHQLLFMREWYRKRCRQRLDVELSRRLEWRPFWAGLQNRHLLVLVH